MDNSGRYAAEKTDRRSTRVAHWLPVVVLCGALFLQSSYPSVKSELSFPLEDKLWHVAAYGVLAALFFRAARSTWTKRLSWKQLFWISVAFASLYGLSDEIHQAFVPSRQFDRWDLLANVIGSLLGAAGFGLVARRRR